MSHAGVKIDHSKIIDSFGRFHGKTEYEPEEIACSRCHERFVFTAASQKHVYEKRGVPVSKRNVVALCDACLPPRPDRTKVPDAKPKSLAAASAGSPVLAEVADRLETANERSLRKLLASVRAFASSDPHAVDARYWEARLQERLGDRAAAATAYGNFLKERKRRFKDLARDAEERLAALVGRR